MSEWVILGAGGMLGTEIKSLLSQDDCLALSKADCDITNLDSLLDQVKEANYILNCAAYTAVDSAEDNEDIAYSINAIGARNSAILAKKLGANLTYVSTDYVFSGDASSPYVETALTAPKSAYGRTKLAGETEIENVYPENSYIIRTAWLYGQYGPNFVKTMINLEETKETISVVNDQHGQPTWTYDLGQKMLELCKSSAEPGIYHGTSSGQTTWYEFTRKIFGLLGADPDRVLPTTSDAFKRPAPRPAYSVLGHDAWREAGIAEIRDWELGLEEAFKLGIFQT